MIFIFTLSIKILNCTESIVSYALDFASKKASVQWTGDKEAAVRSGGVLHLEFAGNLNKKVKGFYRSKYYTPNGEKCRGGVIQL